MTTGGAFNQPSRGGFGDRDFGDEFSRHDGGRGGVS
jgi:hypothetical protein